MKTAIVAFTALLLAQSANAGTEKILGYQPTKDGIIFQVTSGGCTTKEDFDSMIEKDASATLQLTLVRTRKDTCYPFIPMGEKLFFSSEELGMERGHRFRVMNPNGIVHAWIWEDTPE